MTSLENDARNLCSLWSSLIAEELVRLGVKIVCIAPGSRSTPLVVACALRPEFERVVCQDERSAAFFALGCGRVSKTPAVVITTSGSAVANLLPAVVEASNDRIPLLLLTADRPPELRGVGANQTIDQTKIFGSYVRSYADIPVPDGQIPLRFLLSRIDEAMHKSKHPLPGPVHLNFMFREPLVPDHIEPWDKTLLAPLQAWSSSVFPLVQHFVEKPLASTNTLALVAKRIGCSESGIIVAGAINDEEAEVALVRLAVKIGWPIVPDVLSNLRFRKSSAIAHHADLALLDAELVNRQSDIIFQVGGRVVSKRLQQYLDHNAANAHIFVDDHNDHLDPGCVVTHRIQTQLAPFFESLSEALPCRKPSVTFKKWTGNSEIVATELKTIDESLSLDEMKVARSLIDNLDDRYLIFSASSMPIRDLNMFAKAKDSPPRLLSNRGASGIDGIISTACGVAKSSDKRVVLLSGDLTFLHDTNGLALLKCLRTPMVIIVVNNRGGGIFTMLDIHRQKEVFAPYFDAEHEVDLGHLCHAHQIQHQRVDSLVGWSAALAEIQETRVHRVVEVTSDKWKNRDRHERIGKAISDRFEL